MQQVYDLAGEGWSGAKGSDLVYGHDLAIEAWGDRAKEKSSGLTAFAYLWRRFGPPWRGCDDHKDLVSYYLTTADPGVILWLGLSGSALPYAVGYLTDRSTRDEYHKPMSEYCEKLKDWIWEQHPELHTLQCDQEKAERWNSIYWEASCDPAVLKAAKKDIGAVPARSNPGLWREDGGVLNRVNQALFDAMKELERPVYVRDIAINIFGRCDDSEDAADRSEYAGYGIPKEAMDNFIKGE